MALSLLLLARTLLGASDLNDTAVIIVQEEAKLAGVEGLGLFFCLFAGGFGRLLVLAFARSACVDFLDELVCIWSVWETGGVQ